MTQGRRFGLSAAQKSEAWCRWKAGDSLHKIGRVFGKEHSSIRCLVSRNGGFVPAVRRRSLSRARFRYHCKSKLDGVRCEVQRQWARTLRRRSQGHRLSSSD
jgi:hypothetical protein